MELLTLLVGGGLIAFLSKVFEKVFDRITSKHDKDDKQSKDIDSMKTVQEKQGAKIERIEIKLDAITYATMQDLRDRICRYCKEYISLGFVDVDDYENLKNLHEAYHKCGGNGYLDDLMDKVKQLKMVNK